MGARAHLSGREGALLLVLCALLFFLGLGTLGLTDRDEGSNAEAAREMVESGDWLTPTLNGTPRFAKPILIYWLIACSYLAFGVNEFTARLPSALFGTLLVLMQYAFATRLLGPTVGFRAALMLLLNFEALAIGRMALTDLVLGFLPSALVEALRERQDPQRALQTLCAVWVLGVFIFFTLSSTRLPHYIAPLFPAAALLVAASWDRSLSAQGGRAGAASFWLTLGVGCLLGLAFVGLDWGYQRFNAQIAQEFIAAAQAAPSWTPSDIGFLF